jgi:hypothetical protein
MGNAIKIKKNNEEYFLIDKYKNPFICTDNNISILKINLLKEYIDKYNSLPPPNYELSKPEIIDLGYPCNNLINLDQTNSNLNLSIYDENEETKKYLLGDININNFENIIIKLNPDNYEKEKLKYNNLNENEKKNTIMIGIINIIIMSSLNTTQEHMKKIKEIINIYYERIIFLNENQQELKPASISYSKNKELKTNNNFIIFIIIFFVLFFIFIIILLLNLKK